MIDIWSLSGVGSWWVGCKREEECGKKGGERTREKGGGGEVENRKRMRILVGFYR